MSPERFRQIEELYHLAREREASERESFVCQASWGDEELRREVLALLAADTAGPLAQPFVEIAASLLSDIKPGTRLGPYEIQSLLGTGGMGDVYRARDTRLGRCVAIKTAHAEFSGRFLREARAISALNHANICTLYDVGPNYLVMELVEGETLADRAKRERLSFELVLRYGAQIADALAAAHGKGIIHRDLKPSNIMITKTGIKVLDFGLAKIPVSVEVQDHVTDSNAILGTPAYMAPEQLEGKACDSRTDIFALGLVLYEMATGRRAFAGESRAALVADIMRCEPDMSTLSPPAFTHIVERCLAKDPDNRWQTARDVELELEFHGRTRATARPPTQLRRRPAAIAVVLGVFALAAWYFRSGGGDPVAAPFTTDPGLQNWPSFSPDGTRVAYSWNGASPNNFDIWVRQIGPGSAQRLTTSPEWEVAPRWSPDGKWIAFCRRQAHNTGVYVIPALGGPERKVGESDAIVFSDDPGWYPNPDNRLDWSPDGRWLAIAKQAPGKQRLGLALLSFETGEIQQLTAPDRQDDFDGKFAPDGHAIAFQRRPGGFGLMLLSLSSAGKPNGQPREIPLDANRAIRDFAWSADGRDFIVSLGDVESSRLWRVPVAGGAMRMLPFAAPGAAFPEVTSQGNRMVFALEHWDRNIWSLELDRAGRAVGPAMKAFDSTTSEYAPQFSPDGTKVAFQSHRSGTGHAIFTCFSDGSNCAQLSPAGGPHAGSPSWSPDSQWIAYDVYGPHGYDICVIKAGGGKPRVLVQALAEHNVLMPRWSADGKWVYYQYTPRQIWRIRVSGGKPEPVAGVIGASAAESPDGQWLYYSGSPNAEPTSLRRIPVGGGAAAEVLPKVAGRNWVVVDTGIWFLTPSSAEGSLLQFYDFASKATRTVFYTARPVFVGLTVSPDQRRILFTQIDAPTNRNLMLVENLR
ncbi:MAG TPA: protein kinase [Bryobacteraceae bacterium]|jgi:serine/threonine protein kinase